MVLQLNLGRRIALTTDEAAFREVLLPTAQTGGAGDPQYTISVHNGVMKADRAIRQSISLPPTLAKQVGSMAKSRKLSKNRMLLELIENGIDAEKRKQQEFFALAERFRNERDPETANRLGDELGRMVFGG